MPNKKSLILIGLVSVFALSMAGCSGSLGSAWTNFNSYFNTFYNTKQSFDRGYRQFENQVDRINPERPIRIHRSPMRSGVAEFEDTIQRGSDLLLRFPGSRYVDDTVFLIGKSFFFLQNYFNAEQKFIELYSVTGSSQLQQQAVIWRARAMLEMERHNDGINYLIAMFDSPEIEWDRRSRAEAELLMAQFLVKTNQWEEAGRLLFEALPHVRDNELRARGFFLNGQILEFLEEYQAAYDAFDRVRRSNPYYQMIYFSELKKGVMLRKMGRYDESRRHFASMARDNNNFEFLAEINFQQARTLHAMGRPNEAREMYREVLYFSFRTPAREVLAQTHYGLADLYRFDFRNYQLAAAHYDTAARNTSDLEMLPRGFDARSVSRDFSNFARLNIEKAKMDSLLWLGNLPPARFDSVITVIQEDYRRQMRAAERERRRESGRIVNVNPADLQGAAESGDNGFLFHLNRQLMSQASMQFQALWDGRPLVDNWRRMDVVRRTIVAAEEDEELAEEIIFVEEMTFDEYELDLTEIPRTRAARDDMRRKLAQTKYEIGNLYFFSFNQPDSARSYFSRIVSDFPSAEIVPQAMFSISEILYRSGNEDEAVEWAVKIADNHPDTPYARRLANRFELPLSLVPVPVSENERIQLEYHELLREVAELPPLEAGLALMAFGKADTLSSYAAEALFNAVRLFAEHENNNDEFAERRRTFEQTRRDFDLKQDELSVLQDSARVMLSDTTHIFEEESLRDFWQSIADSTLAEPDYYALFPYRGDVWDDARASLNLITEKHTGFRLINRVRSLQDAIRLPAEPEPDPEPDEEEPAAEPADGTGTPDEEGESVPDLAIPGMTSGMFNPNIRPDRPQRSESSPESEPLRPDEMPVNSTTVYEAADLGITADFGITLEHAIEQSGVRHMMGSMNIVEASFSFRVHITAEGYTERVTPLDGDDEFGFSQMLQNQMLEVLAAEPAVVNGERVPVIYIIEIPLTAAESDD
ncbi:MAG: tetratricopeptide repeat protein [Balneolales bacterium]|nr:tetratricopeptide repeat protein [Balneolales bacterium]